VRTSEKVKEDSLFLRETACSFGENLLKLLKEPLKGDSLLIKETACSFGEFLLFNV
jgi:hypothetical protein